MEKTPLNTKGKKGDIAKKKKKKRTEGRINPLTKGGRRRQCSQKQ
jgi:hypothetical protein